MEASEKSTVSPQTARAPTAYLDSALVIAFAKGDLGSVEQEAVFELTRLDDEGRVALRTSRVTHEELDRYQGDGKRMQVAFYNLMRKVAFVDESEWVLSPLVPFHHSVEARLLSSLKTFLDETDARHLFQAISAHTAYFVTSDHATILRHNERLHSEFGILAVLPSELVALLPRAA